MSRATMLLPALLSFACGDSKMLGDLPDASTHGDGGLSAATGADFCESLTRIYCDANVRCCTLPPFKWADSASCLADAMSSMPKGDLGSGCKVEFTGAAFQDGRVRFDPSVGAQLLDMLENAALQCQTLPYVAPVGLVVGTVASGGDCRATSADPSPMLACAPGLYCDGSLGSSTPPPPYTWTCKPFPNEGDACGLGGICGAGLYCDGPTSGFCRKFVSDGGACTGNYMCASFNCAGNVCSTAPPAQDYCESSQPVAPGNWCSRTNFGGSSTSCTASWSSCSDQNSYGVTCAVSAGATSCTCLKNTVDSGSFMSTGFCAADPSTQAAAVRSGCGFEFMVAP
jgi:hypothetical protein